MWEIEYTEEVKFYFIDNGALVFDLLIKIEELRYIPSGIPAEGCTQLEPSIYIWEVLRHAIIYQRREPEHKLRIATIKPFE